MAMVDGLYDVPQTDDPTETAMAALIARFRLRAPKPEALASPAVSDATIALHLAQWVAEIGSALGDRAVLPLLKWDASLDAGCISLAALGVYDTRGRNRQAGADASIDAVAERQKAMLDQLMSADRQRQPRYVDSGGNFAHDAPQVSSQSSSEAWTRPKCQPGSPRWGWSR